MLKNARIRAEQYGVPFSITEMDLVFPAVCPILNVPLRVGGGPFAPSLDRIKPELGYVSGNIQIISKRANSMKNDATLEEMILLGKWAAAQI